MRKKIKNNPLYNFMFRMIMILLVSLLFWALAITYYYEYELGKNLEAEISTVQKKYKQEFSKINFERKNKAYYDFIGLIESKNELEQAVFFEIYDVNEKKLISHTNSKYPSFVDKEMGLFDKVSKEMNYTLIPTAYDEAYLYFQNSDQFGDKKFYLNILIKIDNKMIDQIKDETLSVITIIVITVLFIIILIFPLIYSQYNTLLRSKNALILSNLTTLQSLGNAIAKRDSDTNAHNYRVTYYSIKIAEKMELNNSDIENLIKGAFLHDIGKIAISDNILLKPGKLTKEEFDIMKTHVEHGIDIIKDVPTLQQAQKVISAHHEKVDGSGYPNALKAEQIPLEAKIFAVADVFDALSSKRPYKEPFSIEKSMEIILNDVNSHFDEKVVLVFNALYKELYLEISSKSEEELRLMFIEIFKPYFK